LGAQGPEWGTDDPHERGREEVDGRGEGGRRGKGMKEVGWGSAVRIK